MGQPTQQRSVSTGLASVAAVLFGFEVNLLTNNVPSDWRPFAAGVVATAVVLQVIIGSRRQLGWLLDAVYALLGIPVGVGVNVLAPEIPPSGRLAWTVACLVGVLGINLLNASVGSLGSLPKVRLPSGWALLASLDWFFWGLAAGTVGGVQIIEYINGQGGLGGMTNAKTYPLCFVPIGLVPFLTSILASWMRGTLGSGISAGVVGSFASFFIAVLYYFPTLSADIHAVNPGVPALGVLAVYVVLALVIGATVGGLSGLVGAVLGVGLHNAKGRATS